MYTATTVFPRNPAALEMSPHLSANSINATLEISPHGKGSTAISVCARTFYVHTLLGHSNLMYCFTSTATQYFANLIHKCKFVGVVLKCACAFAAIYRYLAAPRDSYNLFSCKFLWESAVYQCWSKAEPRECCAGFTCRFASHSRGYFVAQSQK